MICFNGALVGASSRGSMLEKKQRAKEIQGKTEYITTVYARKKPDLYCKQSSITFITLTDVMLQILFLFFSLIPFNFL